MKKQLILGAIVLGVAASSFGQGYALFATTGKSWVYDNFSTPGTSQVGGTAGANIDIGLFVSSSASATPSVESISSGNPTGNTTGVSSTAWTSILNDPNYALAANLSGGTSVIATVNTANTTKGGFSYNGGGSFQISGLGNAGGTVIIGAYLVAWNAAYATPAAAAAAGSAVGWSAPFQYTLQPNTTVSPALTSASGLTAFGVSPILAVPEPGTMALAALGGASLLLFRRKK